MRAIWTGALSFGLVNIPVKLYSAANTEKLSFNMLHNKDHSPIRFARICREDGHEVPYEDIVKGYEYQKGDWVVLTDEDFERVNLRKTKTIDIVDFVQESEVDVMYYDKPYYLEPDRSAEKPYALLREALTKSQKVGVAKFVLRNKEHLAIIKPVGGVIVLEQLRFANELKQPVGLKLPEKAEGNDREIEMALALIEQLTQSFKPEDYRDTYTEELEELIDEKIKGVEPKVRGEAPTPTKVNDLMATLKASLEKEQANR